MSRQPAHIILLFAIAAAVSSCDPERFDNVSRSVSLSPFDTIALDDVFDVYLIQDSTWSVTMEGSRNVVQSVTYSVTDNRATFGNDFSGKWVHPGDNKVALYIHLTTLAKIDAKEPCFIRTMGVLRSDDLYLLLQSKLNEADLLLDCKQFGYVDHSPCGGLVRLSGRTDGLTIYNNGLMSVDASQLTAGTVFISNTSKGYCKIFPQQELIWSIEGEGNIYYSGAPPSIIGASKSKGQLIHVP